MKRELSPRGVTRFVGRNEVAEALGFSLKTLGREIKRGHIPRPIQLSPNRVGWPVDVIQKLLESRIARMTEQAVTDPDKLKPEQVADAAVDFAARHISNELGCRVSPDDVVLGFVRRLSSEDADTLARLESTLLLSIIAVARIISERTRRRLMRLLATPGRQRSFGGRLHGRIEM